MFDAPFGSIFSSSGSRLGYLSNQSKASAQEEVPQEPAADVVSEMKQRAEEVEKSQIISPKEKRAMLEDKKPFDVTPPQFRAATTMRSNDPKVIGEQSKLLVVKNKHKLEAYEDQVQKLQDKINAAKIYRDVLIKYQELKGPDKEALDGWVDLHIDAIRKLMGARRLKAISKTNKEAVKSLDQEIKHWENLLNLKRKGVDVQGQTVLKAYRPENKVTKASPTEEGPLPIFKSESATDQIVRLKAKSAHSTELRGLEATDEAVKNLSKEQPKKTYKEIFIDQLPSRDFYLQQRAATKSLKALDDKFEENIVLARQYEWKAEQAEDQIDKLGHEYRKIQGDIGEFINTLNKDPASTKTINALGILVEARPERFMAAPTLLQASMDAFKRLSELGDVKPQTPASPETEAAEMLQAATAESAVVLNELETRQNTLERLKAEVQDKPVPPPLQITIVTPPEKTGAQKTASFINKALPWIAALYILKKMMEG